MVYVYKYVVTYQIQLACQSPSKDIHWNSFAKLKQ